MSIHDNVMALQSQVPESVMIVGVSKYATDDQTRALIQSGIIHLGENKVQDGCRKIALFGSDPLQWHLLGPLQTNKVRKAVGEFSLIQSVDRLKVLEKIDQCAGELDLVQPVLIQLNVSEEPQKHGFLESEFWSNFDRIVSFSNVKIRGIMVIGPHTDDTQQIRHCFSRSRSIFDRMRQQVAGVEILSMGMSQDYAIAIDEGSTCIRVGSCLLRES